MVCLVVQVAYLIQMMQSAITRSGFNYAIASRLGSFISCAPTPANIFDKTLVNAADLGLPHYPPLTQLLPVGLTPNNSKPI